MRVSFLLFINDLKVTYRYMMSLLIIGIGFGGKGDWSCCGIHFKGIFYMLSFLFGIHYSVLKQLHITT